MSPTLSRHRRKLPGRLDTFDPAARPQGRDDLLHDGKRLEER